MNKTLLALTIATLSAPSAMATEYFVGGGLGYHSAKAEISGFGASVDKKATGSAFHIRGGAYLTENHRVTGTVNFTGSNKLYHSGVTQLDDELNLDLGQTEFLISYDYVHAINSQFSLFGGATAGIVNNTLKAEYLDHDHSNGDLSEDAKGSETDFTYGLQAGVQYKLTNELSADLQYRHMFESYSRTEAGATVSIPNNSEFTISLDYRF